MAEPEIAKKDWGPGAWQEEPDRLEWEYKGFPCLMRRNTEVTGSWCGYVAVPPRHPLFEIDYGQCSRKFLRRFLKKCRERYCAHSPGSLVDVHGGLTYTGHCGGDICHKPKPGEPDNVWWLGFDCAHAGDLSPRLEATLNMLIKDRYPRPQRSETYKDMRYAKKEVESLADQLAKMRRK